MALRQRLKWGAGGRPFPRSFLPGTDEGGGGGSGLGAGLTGEAPALSLMFPPLCPSGSSGLGDPAAFSASRGPASLPLAASPRHLGVGEGRSRYVLCS